jgi:hypothetical protein
VGALVGGRSAAILRACSIACSYNMSKLVFLGLVSVVISVIISFMASATRSGALGTGTSAGGFLTEFNKLVIGFVTCPLL